MHWLEPDVTASSLRTGLPGSAPERDVFDVILEAAGRCRAALARRPRPGNEAVHRCVVPQMLDQAVGVAAAIPFRVAQLLADRGAALAEPEELDRRQLPVNTGMRRG